MKIELDANSTGINIINSYSKDGIVINDTVYQKSIIISPQQIITNWPPQAYKDLVEIHMEQIINLTPEIILIGTGNTLIFPEGTVLESLLKKNIGVEVMDTGAACRAYNFIAGEGRLVAAALLPLES
jgi:uncharacterized protein